MDNKPQKFKVTYYLQLSVDVMLEELKAERAGVEQAILVLERIASGRGKTTWSPACVDVYDTWE